MLCNLTHVTIIGGYVVRSRDLHFDKRFGLRTHKAKSSQDMVRMIVDCGSPKG